MVKKEPCALLVGLLIGLYIVGGTQTLWKQYGASSKNWKENYHLISNFISGYFLQNKNIYSKRYMHPMFMVELFKIAKIWKQPKFSLMDEWIKMWFTYTKTHTHICIPEYCSAIKNEILPGTTT